MWYVWNVQCERDIQNTMLNMQVQFCRRFMSQKLTRVNREKDFLTGY